MELNTTLVSSSSANSSDNLHQLTGWNPTDKTRGSIEILWSCCITIVLCCWVSTFPNIPSPNDKWYHGLIDKCNLACIGFLGPDYLLAIALGQLSSAWRSVKAFQELPRVSQGRKWTLVHGFFADMGGFVLDSPDYPRFPVNAEQLHYLVKHGYVDFPDITKADIKDLSKTDSLSKIIVLWQVLWFSASELERVRQGLPMTTFELTALSFALTMLVTSLCWYAKPTISTSKTLQIKDRKTIAQIRREARESTHPGLPETWYRTPLDFVSPYRRFTLDVHWSYYEQLTYMVHLPLFSRKIESRPWDRMPSEAYLVIDRVLFLPAMVVAAGFSLSPLAAWNFHFPTEAERLAWRVCSVYHAVFSILLSMYYGYCVFKLETEASRIDNTCDVEAGTDAGTVTFCVRYRYTKQRAAAWLRSWRNISPDGDPDMAIGLRATFVPLLGTFLYIFCRAFFYIEDFIAIREQPVGVYTAMNKFIPFME
ncbi:hypothetical protein P885DRAFT_46889 [Corynascus similis CBS 632.67]